MYPKELDEQLSVFWVAVTGLVTVLSYGYGKESGGKNGPAFQETHSSRQYHIQPFQKEFLIIPFNCYTITIILVLVTHL